MPTLGTRAAYGAGGAVYAIKEAAYTMFVLLFYTQVLGLNGSLTGAVIAISLLWDGISDPLTGVISDRLRSRHGRRHPLMALAVLPIGLGFLGLFSPPPTLVGSQWPLAGWLLFWSLWVRTWVTLFAIPHLALSAEITSDYQERSQVLGARLAFLFLFSVLVPAVALALIFPERGGADGRFDAANYPLYGALCCVLCWGLATVTLIGTRRYRISSLTHTRLPGPAPRPGDFFRDLWRTFGNPTFRLVLGQEIAIMIAYGTVATLNMLVWTYYWEFSARDVSLILALPSLLAVALVLLTLRPLGRRFEKHQLMQLSIIGLILNCLWLYPLRMIGLLPPNGTDAVFAFNFLFMLVFMYCFLLRAIQTHSLIADVTDEHELDHGLRQEAGFFSAANFVNKFATVFGPLYGGVALDVIGLRAGMRPGEVPAPVLDGLAWAFGLGTLPGFVVALFLVLKIDLGRARLAEIQASLRARGAA